MRGLAAAALVVGATMAEADEMARGRAMAEAFRRGDVGAIWAEMTPEMQAAIGSEAAFGQVRGSAAVR